MEQQYNFINKVYYSKKNRGKRRILLKAAFILCVLVILTGLITGESLSEAVASVGILLVIAASGLASEKKMIDGYKSIPVQLSLNDTEIQIHNMELDKEDGLGKREEIYKFQWKDIQEIDYSKELDSIQILGIGKMNLIRKNKSREKEYDVDKAYLYFSGIDSKEILEQIEKYYSKKIELVEIQ